MLPFIFHSILKTAGQNNFFKPDWAQLGRTRTFIFSLPYIFLFHNPVFSFKRDTPAWSPFLVSLSLIPRVTEFIFFADAHHNTAMPFPPILLIINLATFLSKWLWPGKGLFFDCSRVLTRRGHCFQLNEIWILVLPIQTILSCITAVFFYGAFSCC